MSGKVRHLLFRSRRYYARLVIPESLRPFLDKKTEIRTPLGADRRTALAKLPAAIADLQHKIAIAARKASELSGKPVDPGRYPLASNQIAFNHYMARLASDDEMRNEDHRYANVGVDDRLIPILRDGMAGRLDDGMLENIVGSAVERARRLGNTTAEKGSPEWRRLARARGYNAEWQKARAEYLQHNPYCRCGAPSGCVDHIQPHKGNQRLFWNRANWQPLCLPCHNRHKQRLERRK